MLQAILILELSTARVARIAWPLRKNEDNILPARGDLLSQFVVRDGFANIVAPAVEVNEHVHFRRAVKPLRDEQADGAIRVMRIARKRRLAVFESFIPTRMR